jgi:hypothetical protein
MCSLKKIEKFINDDVGWINARKQSLQHGHTDTKMSTEADFRKKMKIAIWFSIKYYCAKHLGIEDSIIADYINGWLKKLEDKLSCSEIAAAVDIKFLYTFSKEFITNEAEKAALTKVFNLIKNTYITTSDSVIKKTMGQALGYSWVKRWFDETKKRINEIKKWLNDSMITLGNANT